ncbi:carboxymuconolactone decarboxylase family protein [Cryobacterium sp. SO2]|uniref:carboxymuconolactone decarboxylase family protein n=1 Tax=Cryobacterium sp. SO2 TaxID=1897060 RepID=UPI00223DE9B7|nr:carboxymuconolactone decarboxylase family protein [Cryobacterium sp. SO2]WEO78492.1 carboxymuconolactone decarboxylase family protein [Cryobacterium sp. SO2]
MAIISTPTAAEATGATARFYAEDLDDQGYVASHTRAMSLNPEAYAAWEALIHAIAGPMDKRRYELVTLAAALGTRSRHCRLAHGRKSLRYFSEAELVRIALDFHDAGLSEVEIAMMDFAQKVGADASAMTDADSLRLRALGLSDREIVDVALAAAARNYFSRAVQALAVDVDVPPGLSDRLRDALVGGI